MRQGAFMDPSETSMPEAAIAIVGIACKYPGAENKEQFWENLRQGVDAITHFSPEELEDPPYRTEAPNYVPARGVIKDPDLFDAPLFGITPMEASLMDPQQRVFLQTCLACLEDGGYNPEAQEAPIGLFAGADHSNYEWGIRTHPELSHAHDHLQILIGNGLGFFTTRVSYLLNLRGPSVPVQTTCSTSLTAVHLACQSLLGYECDMALAGGCSIHIPLRSGYTYVQDGPLSPDGFCRAFDQNAEGTALGNGAGVVLLKRLEDAVADRDHIYAVIRGSAFNNDGSAKVGFTAPSVEGQRRVIAEAMAVAGVEPADISFVETHGTGTKLGDPIEIEALRQAFGDLPADSCKLGAVKTNIGHCNAAAGVAGLIKTALCLANRTLVPTLHFEKPNPELQLEQSPFTVSTETKSWDAPELLAGVSAFGLGGTNVHAILGEAPAPTASEPEQGPFLLTLSAQSESALVRKRLALQEQLKAAPPESLADWVFTLNQGRKDWDIRQSLVFSTVDEAIEALGSRRALKPQSHTNQPAFLFPGQGTAYPDFGAKLYEEMPAFKQAVDQCAALLKPELGLDLQDLLFSDDPHDRQKLEEATFWQPAIFVCEYALAKTWQSLGIQPTMLMGHSIGEYVAATLSGVFQLADALALIAMRGRETQKLQGGAMLAVIAEKETLKEHLVDPVELAAENGPGLQILAGPEAAMATCEETLKEAGFQTIKLPTPHAFHSEMMAPLMAPIRQCLAKVTLGKPTIPIISNLTGTWLTGAQAQDPEYWAKHTRSTVRFNTGLETFFQNSHLVFLEVGPGQVLSKLVSRHPQTPFGAVASTNKDDRLDAASLQAALGRLWEEGMPLNWDELYEGQQRARLPLPTYPFDGHRFWILEDPQSEAPVFADPLKVKQPLEQWFYQPSWKQAPMLVDHQLDPDKNILIFTQPEGTGDALATALRSQAAVKTVYPGQRFQKQADNHFVMPFGDHQAYSQLLSNLVLNEFLPDIVIFEGSSVQTEAPQSVDTGLAHGFNASIHWPQAMATQAHDAQQSLVFITHKLLDFGMEPPHNPFEAALLGSAWVIPKEMTQLRCNIVDVDPKENPSTLVENLLAELANPNSADQVLYRAGMRWEPHFEAVSLPEPTAKPIPEKATIVIANGLQTLGLELAAHFAREQSAQVVLMDRHFFPQEDEWDSWVAEQGSDDPISRLILRFQTMDRGQGHIRIQQLPLDNAGRLNSVLKEIHDASGSIHAYFHLEAPMEPGLIQMKAAMAVSRHLESRAREAVALEQLEIIPETLVLFAENFGETGIGRAEQAGLHAFIGHHARTLRAKGIPAKTIEWGTTQWAAEEEAGHGSAGTQVQLDQKREQFGMSYEECAEALLRLLPLKAPRMIVSTRDYPAVLEQQRLFTTTAFQEKAGEEDGSSFHPRPDLSSDFVEPRTEVESLLAEVWRSYFDIESIGIDDNFFELGGHSLLAVQLLAKINDTFATQLNMQILFDAPTIGGLAEHLTAGQEAQDEDLEALLDEIEGLSEDEIKQLLEAETAS